MARFDFNKFWEQVRPKNVEQKITNFSAGNVPMIIVGFAGITVVTLGIMVSLSNNSENESPGETDNSPDEADKSPDENEVTSTQPDINENTQEVQPNAEPDGATDALEPATETSIPKPTDVMQSDNNPEENKEENKEDIFASYGGSNTRKKKKKKKRKNKHRKSKKRHGKKRKH